MINVEKLSASSIQDFDKCEILFFLKYVLGYQDPSGDKAEKGTVCHNVLEAVALSELLKQKGRASEENKIFGELTPKYEIKDLFNKAFKYSKDRNPHLKWDESDKTETWDFLSTSFGHKFFPDQHKEIIQPEQYFRKPINEDWAEYSILGDEGVIEKRRLLITGKIDIVFKDEEGRVNYLDYKFGAKPYDWSKYKDYKYVDMFKNIQLCLYYWATKELYPDAEDIVTHIWYPRAGALWTYSFDQEQIDIALSRVKTCFLKLKSISKPSPNYRKHCNMCYFRKASFETLGKPDFAMAANGSEKFKDVDGKASACDSIVKFFSARDIEQVVSNCKKG